MLFIQVKQCLILSVLWGSIGEVRCEPKNSRAEFSFQSTPVEPALFSVGSVWYHQLGLRLCWFQYTWCVHPGVSTNTVGQNLPVIISLKSKNLWQPLLPLNCNNLSYTTTCVFLTTITFLCRSVLVSSKMWREARQAQHLPLQYCLRHQLLQRL